MLFSVLVSRAWMYELEYWGGGLWLRLFLKLFSMVCTLCSRVVIFRLRDVVDFVMWSMVCWRFVWLWVKMFGV